MNTRLVILLFLSLALIVSCKQTTDDLFEEAFSLHKQNKYAAAIEKYSLVIARDNKLQLPWYNRGFCFAAMKKYKEALVDFNKVMDMHRIGDFMMTWNEDTPLASDEARFQVSYEDALYQRAQMNYYLNDTINALKDFQRLIEGNYPEKSNCLLWEGSILVSSGKGSDACSCFLKAKNFARTEDDSVQAAKMLRNYCILNDNDR